MQLDLQKGHWRIWFIFFNKVINFTFFLKWNAWSYTVTPSLYDINDQKLGYITSEAGLCNFSLHPIKTGEIIPMPANRYTYAFDLQPGHLWTKQCSPQYTLVSCSQSLTPVGEGLVTCNTRSCSARMQKLAVLHDVTLQFILRSACLPIISISVRYYWQHATSAPACDHGNAEKLQSDWCCSVWNAGTTPCIASHQTLSCRCKLGAGYARLSIP